MPRMPWAREKKAKQDDNDESEKVRGRERDRCMLDRTTQCPMFVAFGSGSGTNRTIICGEARNNRPGEKYMGEARQCLEQKRLVHERAKKNST